MQATTLEGRRRSGATSGWSGRNRIAGAAVLVLVGSVIFPMGVVFLGILLIALVALDTGVPGIVPYLRPLFRVPVVPVSRRRARLLFAAGIGVLLVACGAAGAAFRGQLRGEWMLRERERLAGERRAAECVEQARNHLAVGEIEFAELTLLGAQTLATIEPGQREEVDELLGRIHRSGNRDSILDVLIHLPREEFEAFAAGDSVPADLEFPERALTYRAVEVALAQLDEARAARAGR